jgi:hypothetical protein
MSQVILVHPSDIQMLSSVHLANEDLRFKNGSILCGGQYEYKVKSKVSLQTFRDFVMALKNEPIEITADNFSGLRELAAEFGFSTLTSMVSSFIEKAPQYVITSLSQTQFTFLVSGIELQCSTVEAVALSPAVCEQLQIDACAQVFVIPDSRITFNDFSLLRSLFQNGSVTAPNWQIPNLTSLARVLGNTALERLCMNSFSSSSSSSSDFVLLSCSNITGESHARLDLTRTIVGSAPSVDVLHDILTDQSFIVDNEDELLQIIVSLGEQYLPLLRHIQCSFLSWNGFLIFLEHFDCCLFPESMWTSIAQRITHPPVCSPCMLYLPSVIVDDLPSELGTLCRCHFHLLWRGSRDGFSAVQFHNRCDGHSNTLTIVRDTQGFIFGGFTPVKWESLPFWPWSKGDNTLQSFLFTLKNPHKVSARKFALKNKMKEAAIYCDSQWGPGFCGGFSIIDDCNAQNTSECGAFGTVYMNDTQFESRTFLTGSPTFTVDEIEVFEKRN